MSDGVSDGHRESLEERARQWRLANYGVKVCYTCGKEGGLPGTDQYSFEKYRHVDHLSGEAPGLVGFCSKQCLDSNAAMLSAVKQIEAYIMDASANVFSPALRTTARKLVEDVLRKSRRPNV